MKEALFGLLMNVDGCQPTGNKAYITHVQDPKKPT